KRGPLFLPELEKPFGSIVNTLANRKGPVGLGAALLQVFRPYLTWNTVSDNARVTGEMGRKPAPFSRYSFALLRFSREHNFEYPYQAWPESTKAGGSAALLTSFWKRGIRASSRARKVSGGWASGSHGSRARN